MATFPSRLMRSFTFFATVWACVAIATNAKARNPEYPPEMYSRPTLSTEKQKVVFQDGLLELWRKALDRPDSELRRATIDAITLAHQRNVPGIDAFKKQLLEIVRDKNETLTILNAASKALIQLDSREAQSDLAKLVTDHGDNLGQTIEPALIAWKSTELKQLWLDRVQSGLASDRMLLSAIDGLAAIGEQEAIPALIKIVNEPTKPAWVRARAAHATGLIGTDSELPAAEAMIASSTAEPLRSFLAIELLNACSTAKAIELKKQFAQNDITVVQAKALEQLFKIDPALVDRLADDLVANHDANVRTWCLRAMLHQPRSERVSAIARLLNDVNPSLRREAASGLVNWAEDKDLRESVTTVVMGILRQNSWQGCEQAAVVLTQLDHQDACVRLVELLKHERPEVKIASAWGLQKLRVKKVLPDMLDHAKEIYLGVQSGKFNDLSPGIFEQQTHLLTAFGDQGYQPAIELLLEYVPKNFELGNGPRTAACWSLGFLYPDGPPDDVVRQLRERLLDSTSLIPEEEPIRVMCAISFGRMKLKSELPSLREEAKAQDLSSRACYWAIEQITGEKPPPIIDREHLDTSWFLTPIIQ